VDGQSLDGEGQKGARAFLPEGIEIRFRKLNRIRKKTEFEEVFKNGKKHRGSFVTLFSLRRGHHQATRVGVVVSKKVGKAVERSRLKRWLREAFRLSLPCLNPGFDLVVVVRPERHPSDFRQLHEEWRQLCKKSGILKNELPLSAL